MDPADDAVERHYDEIEEGWSDIIDSLFAAGFSLEALEEPGPDAEFEHRHPDAADTLAEWPPGALCVRAVR